MVVMDGPNPRFWVVFVSPFRFLCFFAVSISIPKYLYKNRRKVVPRYMLVSLLTCDSTSTLVFVNVSLWAFFFPQDVGYIQYGVYCDRPGRWGPGVGSQQKWSVSGPVLPEVFITPTPETRS